METYAMQSNNMRWMLSADDMKKDALFFVPVGIVIGIIQLVGYRTFNEAGWGGKLLQEHIAFNTLLLITVMLLLAKGVVEGLSSRMEMASARRFVEHISRRAVCFASTAASVIIGFAIVAAVDGAYRHACVLLILSLYFIALAEIAANPLLGPGHSRTCLAAFIIIIVMPFSAHLLV